ncbi:MAG: PAS domain S-box protein [Candidatus Eisenbacteria bacterium]
MKTARMFIPVLAALVVLPWALAPALTGAPFSGHGPLGFDLSRMGTSELATRLPVAAGLFASAVLISFMLGRLKWSQERTRQLDSLFESGDAVVSLQPMGTDAYSLIRATCGKLVQTRGYEAAWIALTDGAGQFRTAAEMGHEGGIAGIVEQMKKGQWPACAQKAMNESHPVVIKDTVSQCQGCSPQSKRYGRASVAVRISSEDRVFGVICIRGPGSVIASVEEHLVLQRIARDLGYALRSMTLAGNYKQTAEQLKWERAVRSAVAESADALGALGSTVPEMARLILGHALRLTESRGGFAHVIDGRSGVAVPHLVPEVAGLESAQWGGTEAIAFAPDALGSYPVPWGLALNTRQPFYTNAPGGEAARSVEDAQRELEALMLAQDEPIRPADVRMLAAPSMADGDLVGQIALAGPHRAYTDRDLDAVARLAEIFGIAIQRARSEHELRVREGTVAAILDPVIVTDPDCVVTHANAAFLTKWGFGNEDAAVGLNAGSFCQDTGSLPRLVEKAIAGGSAEGELKALIREDVLDFRASARTITDSDGQATRVAITLEDLTEEKFAAETERVLWRIAEAACSTRDMGLLFRKTRQELAKIMSTKNFFVALYDEADNTISLPLFLDEFDQNQFSTLPAGKTLTAYAMRKSSPVRATRSNIDELVKSMSVEVVGTPCEVWLGAPLMSEDRALGVIALQSYTDENEFSDRDLDVLAHVAAEVAPAVARKRVEVALRAEQGRFNAVAETVSAALVNTNSHGRILSWNRAAEAMFGYSPEEAVGHPFSLIVPEGFLQAHVDGLMRAVSTDSQRYVRASVEGVGRRKDKSEFPMELSIGAWKTGDETFFTALLTDITAKKQIDEELQFLGSIPLQVSDALIVTDLNYRITYVNKAAEFLFGFAGEELIGTTLDTLSADEWEDSFEEEIHHTVSAGRVWTGVLKSKRKRGANFLVEYRVSPLRDSSGRLSSYISICHDLTERMRTEQLLQTLNAAALGMERSLTPDAVFEAVTDEIQKIGSSCAVLLTDENSGTVSVDYLSTGFLGNDAATEEALSWDDSVTIPIHSFEPLARTVREKKSQYLGGSGDDGDAQGSPSPDDPVGWLKWALSSRPTILAPLIAGDDVTGVLAVLSNDLAARDVPAITAFANQLAAAWRKATLMAELSGSLGELRRTQDILLRAQMMEAVGNLAGGVAHDFNNLLTAITGYAELALEGIDKDNPAHSDINQIRKAAAQAASLTSQLLAFSRQTPLVPKVISVNEVVTNLDKMMRRLVGENIALTADLDPELDRIKADATQIQQVVMNLIINGRDAMPEGGALSIETRNVTLDDEACESITDSLPGEYVRLSVKDTGTGIDPEVADRIFEPFFTTKELGKGTGLGLSVVYGVVSQHGGWINIDTKLGEGTVFTVYLPATSDAITEQAGTDSAIVATAGHGEKILVVEDEDSVRDFALRALRESGYTVYAASDAEEAMALFGEAEGGVDLVFSDVVLPTKSGLELVEEMLGRKPDVRVLLASGYTDTKSQWEAIRDRGFGFLQKPYGIRDLLRTIRETMSAN